MERQWKKEKVETASLGLIKDENDKKLNFVVVFECLARESETENGTVLVWQEMVRDF